MVPTAARRPTCRPALASVYADRSGCGQPTTRVMYCPFRTGPSRCSFCVMCWRSRSSTDGQPCRARSPSGARTRRRHRTVDGRSERADPGGGGALEVRRGSETPRSGALPARISSLSAAVLRISAMPGRRRNPARDRRAPARPSVARGHAGAAMLLTTDTVVPLSSPCLLGPSATRHEPRPDTHRSSSPSPSMSPTAGAALKCRLAGPEYSGFGRPYAPAGPRRQRVAAPEHALTLLKYSSGDCRSAGSARRRGFRHRTGRSRAIRPH